MSPYRINVTFRRAPQPPREWLQPIATKAPEPEVSWGPFDAIEPALGPVLSPIFGPLFGF